MNAIAGARITGDAVRNAYRDADECPGCGRYKSTRSPMCRSCTARRTNARRALIHRLVEQHLRGVRLIVEPGPGMDGEQFAAALRDAIQATRNRRAR